jgi:hypothetical protein
VKRTDVPGARYADVENVDPRTTLSKFIARWVAERKLGCDESLVSLRLVPCTGEEEPTQEQDAAATVLPPRKTLAQAGVADGSWLLAVLVGSPPVFGGIRLLSKETVQLAQRSLFSLSLSSRGVAVGVGVFYKAGCAVTANHILPASLAVGQPVYGVVHGSSADEEKCLKLCITQRDAALDYALLSCPEYDQFYVPPFTGEKVSLLMALCTFKLAVEDYLPEFGRGLAVMPAFGVGLGKHGRHIVYTSITWAGDSGSALLLHGGELVGIHLEVVNVAREALRQNTDFGVRLDDVESSVGDLIASVAEGYIALLSTAFA